MTGIVSQYFLDMVILSMVTFTAVLAYVSIEDAVRHPDRPDSR